MGTKQHLTEDQKQAKVLFNSFINDKEAFDMFITGQAGTGKTTLLNDIVQEAIEWGMPTVVCAYTHKAKGVLATKLPKDADVRTLHSFLRKRPGVNEEAKSIRNLNVTTQFGKPQEIKLLIVDEFSMVGESDALSIGELQDPDYMGLPKMKVLYVGDTKQLPPVGQPFTLQPGGDYVYDLTEVQRQGAGPLLDTIYEIVDMVEGGPLHILEPNEDFHRGVNIADHIKANSPTDFAVLAYTNKKVEELNSQINSIMGDTLHRWSPTLRAELDYIQEKDNPTEIHTHSGTLCLESKYKTLEHLIKISKDYGIKFAKYYDITSEEFRVIAYVFGHYQYKILHEQLAQEAADSNATIDHPNPKKYCMGNGHSKPCRKRAKAWRDYLTFKECVMCVDYPYAMTIHKSQASTFNSVYIDNNDLSQLLTKGQTETYLKLLYVAVSRASDKVYMS